MLNPSDLINGCFELLAAPFILLSIIKTHKVKKVTGISVLHISFISLWGYWNIYYYPHLDQWASFVGGLFIVVLNTIWLWQIIYYGDGNA